MNNGLTKSLRRSSRHADDLRSVLERWLAVRGGAGAEPKITALSGTESNGMSSETVLFDVAWGDGRVSQLVARVAPRGVDVPVFRAYELDKQFAAMATVAEHSSVPVPKVLWYEPDASWLGGTFFVMERVEGIVPSDNPPYAFGGWLFDAAPADRRSLQEAAVRVLVDLHAIDDPLERFAFLAYDNPAPTALRRHVADRQAWYGFAKADVGASPLLEQCWAFLDEHLPTTEGPARLSWGDSRIGNILFRDFEPVAVLDWEMAGHAPREVDLAWLSYMHRTFQKMAERYGFDGMPDFLRLEDVAATYESLSGYTPRNLDLYELYAATQYGIVGMRTGLRAAHFGEKELPADIDDLLINRDDLASLLSECRAKHR